MSGSSGPAGFGTGAMLDGRWSDRNGPIANISAGVVTFHFDASIQGVMVLKDGLNVSIDFDCGKLKWYI